MTQAILPVGFVSSLSRRIRRFLYQPMRSWIIMVTASTVTASAAIPIRMAQTLCRRLSMMARIIARLQMERRQDSASSSWLSSRLVFIDAIDNVRTLNLFERLFFGRGGYAPGPWEKRAAERTTNVDEIFFADGRNRGRFLQMTPVITEQSNR